MKRLIAFLFSIIFITSVCFARTYWFDGVSMWSLYDSKQSANCKSSVIMRLNDSTPWIAWNIQDPQTGEWTHNRYVIQSKTINSDGNMEYYGYQQGNPNNNVCILVDERTKGRIAIHFILNNAYYMDFSGPIVLEE